MRARTGPPIGRRGRRALGAADFPSRRVATARSHPQRGRSARHTGLLPGGPRAGRPRRVAPRHRRVQQPADATPIAGATTPGRCTPMTSLNHQSHEFAQSRRAHVRNALARQVRRPAPNVRNWWMRQRLVRPAIHRMPPQPHSPASDSRPREEYSTKQPVSFPLPTAPLQVTHVLHKLRGNQSVAARSPELHQTPARAQRTPKVNGDRVNSRCHTYAFPHFGAVLTGFPGGT